MSALKKIIALNLKTYAESTGEAGEKLCSIADEVAAQNKNVEIIVCPQAPLLQKTCWQAKHATVFCQACDAAKPGQSTGAVLPEAVKTAGASGTLVNHSEKKIPHDQVREVIVRCEKLGLRVIACADTVREGIELAKFSPWAVAVEPPELIGTGISVSTAKPEVVKDSVSEIKKINSNLIVLVGAGVSNAADVAKSIELGAEGVLLASSFVKAREPKKLLQEMVEALG